MKRTASLLVLLVLLVPLTGCSQKQEYASYTLRPNEFLLGEEVDGNGNIVIPTENRNTAKQLSEHKIQLMNGGKARFVYSDEGYVTFIQGKFSEEKVTDHEEAVASLNGIASLIGLGAGSEFFCVSGSRDDDGYTYYTFLQRYGDVTVQYATLRVIIGPDGYTAGLSSSFVPNLGIAETTSSITADEAVEIVREELKDQELIYYEEQTHKVAVTIDDVSYRTWVVYTDNPNRTAGDWGMQYFEHFVTMDGKYLYRLPVASFETTNQDAFQPERYFDALTEELRTYTVTRQDGTKEQITVPVSFNSNTKKYYLADPKRKIAVADFYTVMYRNQVDFLCEKDADSWENADLLVYDRYIKTYDYYASVGIQSVDGTGKPILLCTNYCDSNRRSVNNAGFCGDRFGFAVFAASDVNTYSEAVDVTGHEFTHGVTCASAVGNYYANESGAINEAYSDIMGNLCEMMGGYTNDCEWLLGENSGTVFRSMSDPAKYKQPVSVSDKNYQQPASEPDPMLNDLGGVHQNSSLLSQMAVKLYNEGMTMEEERSLWITSIELLTPKVTYEQILASLLMSIDINGLDTRYKDLLIEAFNQAGLAGVK